VHLYHPPPQIENTNGVFLKLYALQILYLLMKLISFLLAATINAFTALFDLAVFIIMLTHTWQTFHNLRNLSDTNKPGLIELIITQGK
jgi:hypothetical protein